ncbi:MAG: GxGYxYP domain-containing protein [Candidatus Helarchaeota archaeon]
MRGKKSFLIGFIAFCVIAIGTIPYFLPLYIFDYDHIDWNGADLSQGVVGDDTYFENFLNFSQPTHLYMYDVRGLPYDFQLILTTLQGQVNKPNPTLYLIYRSSDQFWLERMDDYYNVNYTNLNNETVWQLLERYNTSYTGVIIYDPNLMDTVNVATFLAGLNNCIVIPPYLENNFTTQGFNVTYDFRGTFSSRVALYSWAFETYWAFANHQMIASRPYEKVYFRDYIVACKIFTFYLEVGPFGKPDEVQLFRRIIAETPQNIPVWGWFTDPGGASGEYEAVKAISHAGKYSFCAAIPDLTVLSAFNDPYLNQTVTSFDASTYPLSKKIYLTVIVSDGDNVDYCQNYLLRNIWQNPDRGSVPLGITLEPLMARISPVILRYYYENATANEYFIAGPSGAGYCYVDMNPNFPNYLNVTKYAMDQCDMDQVWLLNGYEGFQPVYSAEVLHAYTSSNCNFTGIYLDYHDFQAEANVLLNGVPVLHSMWVERENEMVGKLNSIAALRPNHPLFVFVAWNSWDFSFTKLKNVFNALPNDTYTFLRPDQFAALFKYYHEQVLSESWMNETSVLIFTIIFLFIGVVALAFIWLYFKNTAQIPLEDEHALKDTAIRAFLKIFYVTLDLMFLLAVNFCIYSTVLNAIYLALLLIFVLLGVALKSPIEKQIGVRETFVLSIGLGALGALMFAFSEQFIILLGFPLGILLSRQIQSNHLVFKFETLGKRSFIYSLVIAIAILLLVHYEFYPILIWITSSTFIILAISLIILLNNTHTGYFRNFSTSIHHGYLKGVSFGLLLILLFNPLFAPERFFFHMVWGLENFPTRLTLGFAVAAVYISVVLLQELLRLKNFSFSKRNALILMGIGVCCYLVLPLFFQHVVIFILSFFLYILGVMALLEVSFLKTLPFASPSIKSGSALKNVEGNTIKGQSSFISQSLFWLILGLFLFFIPPTIIIVDSQAIFELLGITGIEQLTWAPAFWTIVYIPSFYAFLVIPLTIFVLLFGIINTLT